MHAGHAVKLFLCESVARPRPVRGRPLRACYLGRLAPYLLRLWRRSVTPDVSSVPRIV